MYLWKITYLYYVKSFVTLKDYLNPNPEYQNYTDPEFTKNIGIFFDNLKHDYPEMLFGFSLERNQNPIDNSKYISIITCKFTPFI